ncbi:hypothetical protein KHQ06_34230 [Nocardia tengchongensis]|uniref:Uncharacterized protein n=1 Tax=Nocardia tengchongensis TaxID=2055889 RepID=A0ABX8CM78_9NOCA|nr:hypothetical protein [Nocardia tengchongensis]QVI21051.1 hypothetical protein KHQ06_34230 [Nocardia tengchongensis]
MELNITVVSGQPVEDLASLNQWLRRERDLAGALTLGRKAPSEQELGGAWDVLSVAVGSGGTFAVLAHSLEVWFRNRPTTTIRITRGANSVELNASSAKELPELLKVLADAGSLE